MPRKFLPERGDTDRIVIGAPNRQVAMILMELYATFERPVFITDVKSAEIIKYASNAFLATKISFINSIADLCEQVGADINMVAKAMGADKVRALGKDNAVLFDIKHLFPADQVTARL